MLALDVTATTAPFQHQEPSQASHRDSRQAGEASGHATSRNYLSSPPTRAEMVTIALNTIITRHEQCATQEVESVTFVET